MFGDGYYPNQFYFTNRWIFDIVSGCQLLTTPCAKYHKYPFPLAPIKRGFVSKQAYTVLHAYAKFLEFQQTHTIWYRIKVFYILIFTRAVWFRMRAHVLHTRRYLNTIYTCIHICVCVHVRVQCIRCAYDSLISAHLIFANYTVVRTSSSSSSRSWTITRL